MKIILLASVLLWASALLSFFADASFLDSIAFGLLAAALSAISILNVFSDRVASPLVRDVAHAGGLIFQFLACIGALLIVAMFIVFGRHILASGFVSAIYVALIAAGPAGLYAIWRTNRTQKEKAASFWKGALIVSLIAASVIAPEYSWFLYHKYHLRNGDQATVIATLDRLARYPFHLRVRISICDSLIMRDIGSSFTRYDHKTLGFLPDEGIGQIRDALAKRFGPDTDKVIEHTKKVAGPYILGQCARWADPN